MFLTIVKVHAKRFSGIYRELCYRGKVYLSFRKIKSFLSVLTELQNETAAHFCKKCTAVSFLSRKKFFTCGEII